MRALKTVLFIVAVCIAGFLFLRLKTPENRQLPVLDVPSPPVISPVPFNSAPVALIRGSAETDIPWASRTPAAKRVRKIFPDPAWMTPEPVLKTGDVITLALFDDAVFAAEISNVTRYPNGAVGMTAHFPNGKGTVYFSYFGGKLTASIEAAGGIDFSIECLNGVHYAVEIDRINSVYFEGAEPKIPAVQDVALDTPEASVIAMSTVVPGVPAGSAIIDVMIVYTPAAKSWAETRNGIENIIASAMQRANTAHTNSDTRVYLNLVHSAEVVYTEQDIYTDLDRLTFTGSTNSAMDEVQILRDQYKADLVCLFEKTEDAGGLGWLLNNTNGTPSRAFCITRVQQASWTYTLVHEWGHNMGCHHSKTQNPSESRGPGLYDYSAGWQWNESSTPPYGYCTIMTYTDFNNDDTDEYVRAAHFSNPDIDYVGKYTNSTGHASDGDNARTIRQVRTVLANYRKAPDVDYDGIPNEWEQQFFGGETNAAAGADSDGDGFSNIAEYIAGSDPTNDTSYFKISTFETPAGADRGFIVRWNSITGRVYGVYQTTNLLNSFQPLEINIVWPQASYTDTVHGAESRNFYKIKVQLAE